MDTVVIADDSGLARMFVRRCFESAGLAGKTILEADGGETALAHLAKNKVDLVITDLNMPNVDGRELLKRIKAADATRGIPVIVVSSATNSKLKAELQALGAVDVLKKPPSPASAAEVLRPLLAQ